MIKFKPLALTLLTILLLTACGESEEEKQKKIIAQQQQQLTEQRQELQNVIQQQQLLAQQPAPPVIQQPAAPVIVQQPVAQQDNTIRDMATGALIGHALSNLGGSNDRPVERVVEHKTVIVHNDSNLTHQPSIPVPVQPVAPSKPSAMDMNKLSQSAKYSPPSAPKPVVASKPSGMNMSRK
jgi:hypothetical protein